MRRLLIDAVLAVGGGLAWAACFLEEPAKVLPFVAFAPLVVLMGRPRTLLWAFVWGFVAWLAMVPWIAPTIGTFGGLPAWLAVLGLVVMCAILALDAVVLAWVGRRVWRRQRTGLEAVVVLPSVWVCLEALRGIYVNGFPWNLAAYAWIDVPGALELSSWVGAWGVSWLVVAANVAVAIGIVRRRWKSVTAWILGILLLLVLAGRFAGSEMPRVGGRAVSILQPNAEITDDPREMWAQYVELLEMSKAECELGPRLLIWPESAAFPYHWEGSGHLRRDVLALAARGCPVLLGTPLYDTDPETAEVRVENAVVLVGRQGVEGSYAKRRLVPFGEYVPFEGVIPGLGKIAREAGRFAPGDEPALLPWGREMLAAAVCYEIVFPNAVAEQVREGATLLVTITNDAWYGDTAAPWQHLRAARFRAAETRRPTLRAALTGVSALIDAEGRVTAELGVGEKGVLRARIRGYDGLTPFVRFPWAVLLLSSVAAIWGVVVALRWLDVGWTDLGKIRRR